jgi:hypothetical protein
MSTSILSVGEIQIPLFCAQVRGKLACQHQQPESETSISAAYSISNF